MSESQQTGGDVTDSMELEWCHNDADAAAKTPPIKAFSAVFCSSSNKRKANWLQNAETKLKMLFLMRLKRITFSTHDSACPSHVVSPKVSKPLKVMWSATSRCYAEKVDSEQWGRRVGSTLQRHMWHRKRPPAVRRVRKQQTKHQLPPTQIASATV